MMNKPTNKLLYILPPLAILLLLSICLCSLVWIAGTVFLNRIDTDRPTPMVEVQPPQAAPTESLSPQPEPSPTATIAQPQPTAASPNPDLADAPDLDPDPFTAAQETLQTLAETSIPSNDLLELAERLQGLKVPVDPNPVPLTRQVGDQDTFWMMDVDENRNYQVTARLAYIAENVYFWVEDGLDVNQYAVKKLADAFDQEIIPTNRKFFGSEWNPGIDGDPRLHVLYARGAGNSIAGYFSSADAISQLVNEYSNQREMFVINADTTALDSRFTYGVLAHEFQHMIHWYQDRNEETWLNEGFADLAAFINGYDTGGGEYVYTEYTDVQLNDWPAEPDSAHYGASFLFMTYFLDRFGDLATQAVVADPDNGLTSIDQVLAELDIQDPLTGKTITADDVFIDWAVANYLQDGRVEDGRYHYNNYPAAPNASPTEILRDCPANLDDRQVLQYGVDTIRIRCEGEYTLRFSGSEQIKLLPTDAHSGDYFFWSNQGDESDMTLSQVFDFTQVTGPLTLNYWTWYDIEEGYDQVYLLASPDNGASWQILNTPSGSLKDLSGNSFGWAYTGQSGDSEPASWILETVDLSEFAGKSVEIRFEYVTDAAVNGSGLVLDDISIPEIGYQSDFEAGTGGWTPQGFVRVQNLLPQTYRLAVIEYGTTSLFNRSPTRVSNYTLNGNNQLELNFRVGEEVKEVILVVSGTTRITREAATYQVEIMR